MHGVSSPQHLERLGLITDEELRDQSVEMYILLQQALAKIPEIPYSLLIDKYRWDIFKGKISINEYNRKFWELNLNIRGIIPPETRNEEYFDAGAKFHIPDNTPYIRYDNNKSIIVIYMFHFFHIEFLLFNLDQNGFDFES